MASMKIDYLVTDADKNKKVYHVLKGPMKLSGRLITRLKSQNGILLNGKPIRTIDPVIEGDIVSVIIESCEKSFIEPEEIPITILYEDECILAVDKKPHMPVHPSAIHQTGTLAHGVLWHYRKAGTETKIRPVNRLDRDTSGIVVFAKNSHIQDQLIRQMKENQILKIYHAIVHGTFEPPEGTIDLPIARKAGSILERTIDPSGDRSVTHYRTIKTNKDLSLVEFILETGRTHQIRVHSKAMGHPILGDWLYSDIPTDLIDRQALHASRLSFHHPLNGSKIELYSPLPFDMKRVLDL